MAKDNIYVDKERTDVILKASIFDGKLTNVK